MEPHWTDGRARLSALTVKHSDVLRTAFVYQFNETANETTGFCFRAVAKVGLKRIGDMISVETLPTSLMKEGVHL